MIIKEYRTELDEDNKNILCEIGHYNINKEAFNTPYKVSCFAKEKMHLEKRAEEYCYIVGLNIRNQPMGLFEISHGLVGSSLIGVREIFIRLLLIGAVNFVMIHNHPSGEVSPSPEDCRATQQLIDAGKLMGVTMVDSIIVCEYGYHSLREHEDCKFKD